MPIEDMKRSPVKVVALFFIYAFFIPQMFPHKNVSEPNMQTYIGRIRYVRIPLSLYKISRDEPDGTPLP